MSLPKRYQPDTTEPQLEALWQAAGLYHFDPQRGGPVYSIDTPPPTVSGYLHLGHVYSYSQTDFMARFWRMNGCNVYYPMGYDDNGLPTERLVEKRLGIRAAEVGRQAFIEKCLEVSVEAEQEYQELWQRLGLSIDWRYTYRTIDTLSRRTSQLSFIDLYQKGLAYRRQAPSIWCPECHTAIAEAEMNDLERETVFYTLAFELGGGGTVPIATTRPELLPACVAVFVHPDDKRFASLVGQQVTVPLFGQQVTILQDKAADPEKGAGVVMCCTFGDATDVQWWYTHHLPLVEAIGRDGRMTAAAREFAGLETGQARRQIIQALDECGLLLDRRPTPQSVRVHERCDTPVEHIVTQQWFVRVLDFKRELLEAGDKITWHPPHMQARYRDWIQGLKWDWCISRQRYYGVPFPVWYCAACGEIILAAAAQLPVEPFEHQPDAPCPQCGGTSFAPEQDVMDTWATSSLTPQIVGQWLGDPELYRRVFPFSLRPQAHEIIRTWAFYTIAKSHHHFGALPWKEVAISGWGLAPEGAGKISKSKGGGPVAPMAMIEKYSADAVRYWAASTSFGKDSVISEDKVQAGAKLVTKLWNVAQFSQRFLEGYAPPALKRRAERAKGDESPSISLLQQALPYQPGDSSPGQAAPTLSLADRWILSHTQRLIRHTTELYRDYEYATAKSEIEAFFWQNLTDNYLEMIKLRLYEGAPEQADGARWTLHHVFLAVLKLLAPILPYVTEEIYRHLFVPTPASSVAAGLVPASAPATPAAAGLVLTQSIHLSHWPTPDESLEDDWSESVGERLIEIATGVRRFKTEHGLALGSKIERLQVTVQDAALAQALRASVSDIMSITRADQVEISEQAGTSSLVIEIEGVIAVAPEQTRH
jgi:valyl-tRNA synthetase